MRIITFFFLFIFGLNFSQTTQETINWINKMSYNRHYVISAEKTKVTLLNTRHVQGWATISTYEIINPSTVSKIFYSIDKDGWGLINIVFNKQTSIPTKTVIKYENNTNKDEEKIELDGTCFLCGYDWSNIDELLENIEIQSLALEEITSTKSKIFNDELTKFKEEVILLIIETLNQKIQDDNFDINFVNKFSK